MARETMLKNKPRLVSFHESCRNFGGCYQKPTLKQINKKKKQNKKQTYLKRKQETIGHKSPNAKNKQVRAKNKRETYYTRHKCFIL